MESQLLHVFSAFAAGGAELDGRSFVKCLRDAGLLDGSSLKIVDADLIFVKCKEKGARKIVFAEFGRALAMVAARKGMQEAEVVQLVCSTAGPHYETGSQSGSGIHPGLGMGPERFYYDKSTYTGTHRHGGPTVVGGGVSVGDVVQDSQLVNREVVLEDALHRKKSSHNLPMLLGGEKGEGGRAEAAGAQVAPGSPDKRDRAVDRSSMRRPRSPVPVGPERFYYDKSTYTGTHKNGGPTTVGSGLSKRGGYEDLSQLVNRGHVQDDALHRKKEDTEGTAIGPVLTGGTTSAGGAAMVLRGRSQPPLDDAPPPPPPSGSRRLSSGAGPLPEHMVPSSLPVSAPPPAVQHAPTAPPPQPMPQQVHTQSLGGGYPAQAYGLLAAPRPLPSPVGTGQSVASSGAPPHAMAMSAMLAPQASPYILGSGMGQQHRWAMPLLGHVAYK